jgi:hypothetical protein
VLSVLGIKWADGALSVIDTYKFYVDHIMTKVNNSLEREYYALKIINHLIQLNSPME